jgi:hypothetical protein
MRLPAGGWQYIQVLIPSPIPWSKAWNELRKNFITKRNYRDFGVGNSFNALINSGIVHPTGALLVLFIAPTLNSALVKVNGNHHLTHAQLLPPLFH